MLLVRLQEDNVTGLLKRIARRCSRSEENVATEALAFLLEKSKGAAEAFAKYACSLGISGFDKFTVQSQREGETDCRPDLTLLNAEGQAEVLVEGKLWAALTDNQPTEYFSLLKKVPGLLLFVAPEVRIHAIWNEMVGSCRTGKGFALPALKDAQRLARVSTPNGEHFLAICSWGTLMRIVRAGCQTDEERFCLNEIEVLVVGKKDKKFTQLSPGEAGSTTIAERVWSYMKLVPDILDKLEGAGVFVRLRKAGSGKDFTGEYGSLSGFEAWVGFDPNPWSRFGITPIWLEFEKENELPDLKRILDSRMRSKPERCHMLGKDHLVIPIRLREKADREVVTDAAALSVVEVANLLREHRKRATTHSAVR
jgi:hypothetical protein